MNKFISIISTGLLYTSITSCSCAIYSKSWQHEQKKPISDQTIKRASSELDFHEPLHLGRTEDGRLLTLYSSKCPTPYTLLSGGSDFDEWNLQCEEAHIQVTKWFKQNDIPVIKANLDTKINLPNKTLHPTSYRG